MRGGKRLILEQVGAKLKWSVLPFSDGVILSLRRIWRAAHMYLPSDSGGTREIPSAAQGKLFRTKVPQDDAGVVDSSPLIPHPEET